MESKANKRPVIVACILALTILLWMLSGSFKETEGVEKSSALSRNQDISSQIVAVRVADLSANEEVRNVLVSGRTEPNRRVILRAETEGTVVAINADRGAVVNKGDSILRLDQRDRNARLSQTDALVNQRQLEFEAIENLRDKEFTTQVQRAEAYARLEAAKAARANVLLEIEQTNVSAPFDALIQDRSVELGDYVRAGDNVIELVDMDPLVIAGEVNEREISALAIGGHGKAVLESGLELDGVIRYVAPVANANTRAFIIELAVPNPGNLIRAGLTAELSLQAGSIVAHTLSPALLSLADDGSIGVKTVDEHNRVQFTPVQIVSSVSAGVNVTGLPDSIRLITVGQGFVKTGQEVDPVLSSELKGRSTVE